MDKLQLADLGKLQPINLIQIHSLDWMLYQVSVHWENNQKLLYDGQSPYRFHSLQQIKERLETLQVNHYQLIRDHSVYDEMIGQSEAIFSDAMAVDLFWNQVTNIQH